MTKEELEEEAYQYDVEHLRGSKGARWYHNVTIREAYLAGAKPREKRIAELEEKIEKMMCCSNCKNCRRKFIKKNVFEHTCKVEHCKNYDKWEIKEND